MSSSPVSRVALQAAFVLHHRAFRDTSTIANLLTPDSGRVDVIARGARSPKSRRRVLLQPFRPLLASWTGRTDLHTLTGLEESGQSHQLSDEALGCAYYVTELILRLVPRNEPAVQVFALYARTLSALSGMSVINQGVRDAAPDTETLEQLLRVFEVDLLDSLGLLPDLSACDSLGKEIDPVLQYYFDPRTGIATAEVLTEGKAVADSALPIMGSTLLGIWHRAFDEPGIRIESKQVMRRLLLEHLGNQPLKSRAVFAQFRRTQPGSDA